MAFLSSKPKPRERHPLPPSLRKWTRGQSPIASLEELGALTDGGYYIFVDGRSAGYHPSFVVGWQFRYLRQLIRAGRLFPGVRNPRFPFVFRAVWHKALPAATVTSKYLVSSDEITRLNGNRFFEAVSRDYIIKQCRHFARVAGGAEAKAEVRFDDSERET